MSLKPLLAAVLATVVASTSATEYFIVVPLPAKRAALDAIQVKLDAVSLPAGIVGSAYGGFDLNQVLSVTGDSTYSPAGVSWSVIAGALPAGLTINRGVISGTPAQAGNSTFTVRATYKTKTGDQAYQVMTLNISMALAAAVLPESYVGTAYTYNFRPLATVAGDPNYDTALLMFRSADPAALPSGLSLSSAGMLSGVPLTEAAGASFAVVATYRGKEVSRQYALEVHPAFFVFNPTIPPRPRNTTCAQQRWPQAGTVRDR